MSKKTLFYHLKDYFIFSCGAFQSSSPVENAMVNSFLNCKTSIEKLQFGIEKCKKIHMGKEHESYKCQKVYVDNWQEQEEKAGDKDII